MKEIFYKAKLRNSKVSTVVAQKVFDKDGSSYLILIDSAILSADKDMIIESVPEKDTSINTVKDFHQKSFCYCHYYLASLKCG